MAKQEHQLNAAASDRVGKCGPATALTAVGLITWLETQEMPDARKRDQISAINRVCQMGGVSPGYFAVTAASVRSLIAGIEPAAHRVSPKTWSNIQSNLTGALVTVGIIDGNLRGLAKKDASWSKLYDAVSGDKGISNGLARFMSYCTLKGVPPTAVDDALIVEYHHWLEQRTLVASPLDHARRIPGLWNKAADSVAGWPQQKLAPLAIGRKPRKIAWADLPDHFRLEAEVYLEMRRNPDPFDEDPNAPSKPLAESTLRQQREHIRLSVNVLAAAGTPPADLTNLVEPESVKAILRHYLDPEDQTKPNAFAVGISKTLIAIAKTYLRVDDAELARLKKIANKLPSIPFDLTEKNKALLRHFDDEQNVAALFALVDELLEEARERLEAGNPYHYVPAHAAIAIALLLSAPLRAKNLISLNWSRHLLVPGSKRESVRLIIPKSETKTKRADCVFLLDDWLMKRLNWYRRKILPTIGSDPNGDLFAMPSGEQRSDGGFADLITQVIKKGLGIHMTRHQFRHLAAKLYLDQCPEDFETIRQLLGHSFAKTTMIYAGLSGERASKAYGSVITEQREKVRKLKARQRKSATPRRK